MSDFRKLADILSELHARRGYSRFKESESLGEAWNTAVGKRLAAVSRVGTVRRGVLEVTVADSACIQELQFQKERVLTKLMEIVPEQKIRDLRCKVGTMQS